MILKLRNKMTMAMDKMIEEAKEIGGVPGEIIFEPKEAVEFIREIHHSAMKLRCKKNIEIRQSNSNEPDVRLQIWGSAPLLDKDVRSIIERWYKRECKFTYRKVDLFVVHKSNPTINEQDQDDGERPQQD